MSKDITNVLLDTNTKKTPSLVQGGYTVLKVHGHDQMQSALHTRHDTYPRKDPKVIFDHWYFEVMIIL